MVEIVVVVAALSYVQDLPITPHSVQTLPLFLLVLLHFLLVAYAASVAVVEAVVVVVEVVPSAAALVGVVRVVEVVVVVWLYLGGKEERPDVVHEGPFWEGWL